jgi:hypothetical protein
VLVRLAAHALRDHVAALAQAYDIYIILPLQLERLLRPRGGDGEAHLAPARQTLRNPADPTTQFRAPR